MRYFFAVLLCESANDEEMLFPYQYCDYKQAEILVV
jgi:hypothetical protein